MALAEVALLREKLKETQYLLAESTRSVNHVFFLWKQEIVIFDKKSSACHHPKTILIPTNQKTRDVPSPTLLFTHFHLSLIQASAVFFYFETLPDMPLKVPFGTASLSWQLCNTNSSFSVSTSRNWQEKLALTEKRKLEEAEKLKVM